MLLELVKPVMKGQDAATVIAVTASVATGTATAVIGATVAIGVTARRAMTSKTRT